MKQEVPLGQVDYTVLVKIRTDAGAPATGLDEVDVGRGLVGQGEHNGITVNRTVVGKAAPT